MGQIRILYSMQVDLSFGEYLRRLRRQKAMPLQDVARRARLSTTHLSRLENDNGLPTADTVVKIHNVLGGDLSVMLELAKCLPDEIFERYIRRADDEAPVLKRSATGNVDDPLFAEAYIQDMDPGMRRALARHFGLSERDAEGMMTAMRRLAKMDAVEREQVIGVLKLATRGVDT
jgi:transcriptional regulator with XRE-family HTH domain